MGVLIVLHGKGEQAWMTGEFENERRKGLLDRDNLTSEEQTFYGVSGAEGGGNTDSSIYEVKQFPFPTDRSKKKDVNLKNLIPSVGDGWMSDE